MAQGAITIVHASGSTNGRMIKVAATATAGTLLHTAYASATEKVDIVTVYATNNDTVGRDLTIELGGVTSPDDLIKRTIPPGSGLEMVVDRAALNNGVAVRAFASVANVISCLVEVQRFDLV